MEWWKKIYRKTLLYSFNVDGGGLLRKCLKLANFLRPITELQSAALQYDCFLTTKF